MLWQLVAVMSVLGPVACAPRAVPLPRRPPSDTDPAVVYATVRRDEDRVQTLRVRFYARVSHGDEIRDASGVLLVKKPERFRVRLLSLFGLTVFDYVSRGSHARMVLPLEGKIFTDTEIDERAAFSPADMRQAFLRGGHAVPERCAAHPGQGETVVSCQDPSGELLRVIRIGAGTSNIRQETTFVGGRTRLIMEFTDHRPVDGVELPFSIALSYPQQAVRLSIMVENYVVNPALPDSLFDDSSTETGSRCRATLYGSPW